MVTLTCSPWPSPAEYEFLCQLVYKHSRIHLGPDKKEMVGQRLQRRMKTVGLSSYQEYCDFLKSYEGRDELAELMDAISTNVPSFFREEQHFQFLANTALPQWVADPNRRPGDVFQIWSAGCSSGEEPYSAAIVLADFFGRHPGHQGQVAASDISLHALQRAREGTYRIEDVKLPEVEWLKRYFLKGVGAYQGKCRVKDDVKKLVTFRHSCLFQNDFPADKSADVIFCRNVMCNFDRESREDLVQRLSRKLTPGGHLLIGHSESLLGMQNDFNKISPSIYHLQTPTGRIAASRLIDA
jgi:chemotaxis protein methyltransferase CheR